MKARLSLVAPGCYQRNLHLERLSAKESVLEDYMNQKVNLSSCASELRGGLPPRSVATLNNYKVMVVKVKGDVRLACAHGD